jgi:hypothetical protein
MHVQFCLAVLCCCTAAGLVDAWLPASAFTAQHVASRQAARCSTSKQSHTRVATAPSMMFDFSKFTWGKKPVTAAAALAAPTSPAALTGTFDVAVIGAGPGGAVMVSIYMVTHTSTESLQTNTSAYRLLCHAIFHCRQRCCQRSTACE